MGSATIFFWSRSARLLSSSRVLGSRNRYALEVAPNCRNKSTQVLNFCVTKLSGTTLTRAMQGVAVECAVLQSSCIAADMRWSLPNQITERRSFCWWPLLKSRRDRCAALQVAGPERQQEVSHGADHHGYRHVRRRANPARIFMHATQKGHHSISPCSVKQRNIMRYRHIYEHALNCALRILKFLTPKSMSWLAMCFFVISYCVV